jgi:hypothetical protein
MKMIDIKDPRVQSQTEMYTRILRKAILGEKQRALRFSELDQVIRLAKAFGFRCGRVSESCETYYLAIFVKRIPDIAPILELVEELIDIEFTGSFDSDSSLARNFKANDIVISAIIDGDDGTCKRVVVDTTTVDVTQLVCS